MSRKKRGLWEARITIYRNGRTVRFNDALGDSAEAALYNAHNDIELWSQTDEAREMDGTDD